MMIKKFLIGTVAALAFTVTAASAATLNFVGSGQTHVVTHNDINAAFNTEIQMITGDEKSLENGLFLDLAADAARITYTYLGFEAGNSNFAAILGGTFFNTSGTNESTVGDQVTTYRQTSGLLNFAFGTVSPFQAIGAFMNNGLAYPASPNYAIGYSQIDANSFYVLFDDIASGDRDFDDVVMRIDVAAVPLPAGGLLLMSVLAGAAAVQSRKKTV